MKARADWLVKLLISFATYLRAQEKMTSQFASVTSEEIIQINFLWCIFSTYYLTVLVYTKTTIHLSVGGKRRIGPLHDPVTWYKITYTGEQIATLRAVDFSYAKRERNHCDQPSVKLAGLVSRACAYQHNCFV